MAYRLDDSAKVAGTSSVVKRTQRRTTRLERRDSELSHVFPEQGLSEGPLSLLIEREQVERRSVHVRRRAPGSPVICIGTRPTSRPPRRAVRTCSPPASNAD